MLGNPMVTGIAPMSLRRNLELVVPEWNARTFPAAVDGLSEAGFVPEVRWEATAAQASRLTSADERECALTMWIDGTQAWFSVELCGKSWLVTLSLSHSWFEQRHDDWRQRLVRVASAFNATTAILAAGEDAEEAFDVADDRDLARLLALESIAEVWVAERELAAAPFQVVGGYRLFRGEGRPYPHVR